MLPKGYLCYTLSAPLSCLLVFLLGYVLGRAHIGFAASLCKLLILLTMLFILQMITYRIRRKYSRKKKKRKRFRAPEEYYDRI
jgi:membrane protein DedA with SNARE-associated domain